MSTDIQTKIPLGDIVDVIEVALADGAFTFTGNKDPSGNTFTLAFTYPDLETVNKTSG